MMIKIIMIMIMTVTHSSILWRWVQAIRWSRPRSVTRGQLSSSRMVSLIMMMMIMMIVTFGHDDDDVTSPWRQARPPAA